MSYSSWGLELRNRVEVWSSGWKQRMEMKMKLTVSVEGLCQGWSWGWSWNWRWCLTVCESWMKLRVSFEDGDEDRVDSLRWWWSWGFELRMELMFIIENGGEVGVEIWVKDGVEGISLGWSWERLSWQWSWAFQLRMKIRLRVWVKDGVEGWEFESRITWRFELRIGLRD